MGSVVRDSGRMRIAVSNNCCIGNGCDLHGACRSTEPGDGNVVGDVGKRWDEVGVGDRDDHGGDSAPGER
jgi:hypothetical protein